MKVSCLQENLSEGLGIVGRAVATRTTLPITNNVLIATDNGRLKLSATNLEIAITDWIGAKVEEEGVTTVPARLLSEFVSSLPNEQIELTLPERSHSLNIKCARFEAHITGSDPEEFPPIPTVTEGLAADIEPEVLSGAIHSVVFAAATEDSRPVLTGVQMELKGDTMVLAAADGFRLAVHEASLGTKIPEDTSVIIPGKTLSELSRLMGEQEEPVSLMVNPGKSQVLFRLKNLELVSQLIQGTFPNYGQLIPKDYVTKATVDVAEFARATKAASIFARDGSGIVRVQMSAGEGDAMGKMSVAARSEEVGDDLGEIDATVEGEAAKIAFNSKYLTDVLNVLGKGSVALETTSPSSPGVLRPVTSPEGTKYVHVVMPMFVQW
ncbi:MAG: DNA polymerase III subunit beta [Dehalococcoidia bacterium]